MTERIPAYVQLLKSGELEKRVIAAYDLLSLCDVCAWHCPVDRRAGELGVCKTGVRARLSSYGPHMGEEDLLRGLRLPLVYNSGGFDSLEMLHLLDDVIDIYMPDMKYADEITAHKYSRIRDYPQVNQEAVREMH